ncbi:hypothetical protein V8D89_007521 [Ganoderma adspersum]
MDLFTSLDFLPTTAQDTEDTSVPIPSAPLPLPSSVPIEHEHDPTGSGHFYCVIA